MKVGSLRRRSLQVTATSERHPYGAAAQRQTQNVHRSPKKVPRPPCHTCHRDEPNWLRASQQHEEAVRDNRRDGASAPSYPAAKGISIRRLRQLLLRRSPIVYLASRGILLKADARALSR